MIIDTKGFVSFCFQCLFTFVSKSVLLDIIEYILRRKLHGGKKNTVIKKPRYSFKSRETLKIEGGLHVQFP